MNNHIFNEMLSFFELLSNSTRLKIVMALLKQPLNVKQLQIITEMSQTAVSHQLKKLKCANLVVDTQVGKERIYELKDEHVNIVLMSTKGHIEHTIKEKNCETCYLRKECKHE